MTIKSPPLVTIKSPPLMTITSLQKNDHQVASITNNPLFTSQFVANCQQYRTTLRIYTGFGGESNAVVSPLTSYLYCQTNPTFATVFTNFANMTFCINIANQITALPGITNTPQFFQLGVIP